MVMERAILMELVFVMLDSYSMLLQNDVSSAATINQAQVVMVLIYWLVTDVNLEPVRMGHASVGQDLPVITVLLKYQ